ncbi:lycopene cyclase family protein [Flavisolibacter ginsenosidimutans]|uniref:Lycopene cyclase n=1 Tax=Flavisolibacter ginsenosidimutans TaxID=661481 RepID=A0A5B8UMI9_9BACT|nr:lycopene cyclase family protein [Flavisolibacter ginsenosidimutans]QEC57891.1 lycopene cyclase [Flavisolibacter ginsenosidimutans]
MPLTQYDYIIAGTGCAGLSLALHMLQSGKLHNKKILLVDEALKNKNDRTWCFWEKEKSLFEPIVFRQWDKLWFYGEGFGKELSIAPYRYKMIRGIDFYNYCFEQLKTQSDFHFLQGKVERPFSSEKTGVVVNGETFYADYVFNSILFEKPLLTEKQHWLLQHFKGWQIKTKHPAFDESHATLMDFRTEQEHGTAFCYVLPFAGNGALVEYTLFTPALLKEEDYNEGLKRYVEDVLGIHDYEISDTEFGVIPMTDYRFPPAQNKIINIGTAGGQTKGSSGYTFYFIQQHSKALVESLVKTGKPFTAKTPPRFHFYDSVLLHILQNNTLAGNVIFSTLFQKNKAADVLTFLNNESSLQQELKIISSLPTMPFLKAAAKNSLG